MRLCWLTDIHLDFVKEPQKIELAKSVAQTGADVVLLSGDIAIATTLQAELELFCEHVDADVLFVLGNHDYYRGSLKTVREACTALDHPLYLHGAAPVAVDDRTAIVGVDGWGDGRFGDPEGSDLVFNDWALIAEFAAVNAVKDVDARLQVLNALGDESARKLEQALATVVQHFEHVIIVTHVPPFDTAAGNNGSAMAQLWIPWLGCAATGAVIERVAVEYPHVVFEVLSGHTHTERVVHPRPNIISRTGGATYRDPQIQRVWDL